MSEAGHTPEEVAILLDRVKKLEDSLQQNDNQLALAFQLPPRLCDLLGLLLSLPVVTSEVILYKLELATNAKVAVHRLRKAMSKQNVKIHSRRGQGYWLDEDTKQRLKTHIAERIAEMQATPVLAPLLSKPIGGIGDIFGN